VRAFPHEAGHAVWNDGRNCRDLGNLAAVTSACIHDVYSVPWNIRNDQHSAFLAMASIKEQCQKLAKFHEKIMDEDHSSIKVTHR